MNLNISSEVTQTLDLVQVPVLFNHQPLAISENQRGEIVQTDYAHQLTTGGGKPGQGYPPVIDDLAVRRLTPRECERLMGWPDDHTRWAHDGTEIADSHRYKMCGNGVVAPVAEWIGRRLP
jgi:DNA (cytosine-5)-methyltransferase 1